jgi:membrane protease YdiL (CAAX protease family)
MAAHPHPEPRLYPAMLRTWDYAFWKPVVGILLLAVGGLLVMPLLLMPVLATAVALEGGSGPFADRFMDSLNLDSVTPASMLYLNLTLASLTLVSMGIVRLVHRLRPRWLSSVLPGMRWKFFFACFGLAVVALFCSIAISYVLPQNPNEVSGGANELTGRLVATGIVILLTTPLQALGEEYAFRGYLMQAFGSLTHGIAQAFGLSNKVANWVASGFALVVTSALFAWAHGAQNFPLFFDRFSFGLMAGLVVILVGGLEAGIALHILNNLLAFGIAIFFGDLDGALTVSEVSWWQLPVTVVQNGIYLVLVLIVARRMGLRNKTAPPLAAGGSQAGLQAGSQAVP